MRRTVALAKFAGPPVLALLAQGCRPGLSGEVRDAVNERPVADARVEVTTVGWGRRDGDLVWDKSFSHATSTDAHGRFELDVSGGVNLRVSGQGFRTVDTSLCSRPPIQVRVGGPFDGADLGKQLRSGVSADASPLGWRFGAGGGLVPAAAADFVIFQLPTTQSRNARLRAPLGLAFVSGTGNPPTPPGAGYTETLDIDLLDCGWLFVRTASAGVAAVRSGTFGIEEPIEGGVFVMLSFGELPVASDTSE